MGGGRALNIISLKMTVSSHLISNEKVSVRTKRTAEDHQSKEKGDTRVFPLMDGHC